MHHSNSVPINLNHLYQSIPIKYTKQIAPAKCAHHNLLLVHVTSVLVSSPLHFVWQTHTTCCWNTHRQTDTHLNTSLTHTHTHTLYLKYIYRLIVVHFRMMEQKWFHVRVTRLSESGMLPVVNSWTNWKVTLIGWVFAVLFYFGLLFRTMVERMRGIGGRVCHCRCESMINLNPNHIKMDKHSVSAQSVKSWADLKLFSSIQTQCWWWKWRMLDKIFDILVFSPVNIILTNLKNLLF